MSDPLSANLKHLDTALGSLPKSPPSTRKPMPPVEPLKTPPEETRSRLACAKKQAYPSAQIARGTADMNESLSPGLKLYTYKCPACSKWHLSRRAAP